MSEAQGDPATFEEALARLEQIVGQLEDGRLGLADALARYEEGIRCLKQCYATLEQAERRIEIVAGVDAQGAPVVEPLTDESLSLEEKAAARSRRRSKASRSPDVPAPPRDDDEGGEAPDTIDRGRSLF